MSREIRASHENIFIVLESKVLRENAALPRVASFHPSPHRTPAVGPPPALGVGRGSPRTFPAGESTGQFFADLGSG